MNKYEVRFKDIHINGDIRSWKAKLPQFDAGTLIKHLAAKGLKLNCFGNGRFVDSVSAEEWDDTELHGRIIRGGTQQIGSFVVRELSAEELAIEALGMPRPLCLVEPDYNYSSARNDLARLRETARRQSRSEPLAVTVHDGGYPCEVAAGDEIPF